MLELSKMKALLKQVLPQPIVNFIRKRNAVWKGNYQSWDQVAAECTGYDQNSILEKVATAAMSVKNGEFPFERDSMLFDEIVYSWPVLAGLLWSNSIHGELNVLDFGGSLGSTYYQNKKFISPLRCSWNVVEQKNFYELGKKDFQTEQLHFFDSVKSCVSSVKINTLFISSTLQYLKDPISFLKNLLDENNFPIVILDRLSIIESSKNRLTKQNVPTHIYEASYPCWFFSENLILEPLKKKYQLVEKFESVPQEEVYIDGDTPSKDYGYIFKLK